jgi:hypothetical protein
MSLAKYMIRLNNSPSDSVRLAGLLKFGILPMAVTTTSELIGVGDVHSSKSTLGSMSRMGRAAERYAFILSRLLQSNSTP